MPPPLFPSSNSNGFSKKQNAGRKRVRRPKRNERSSARPSDGGQTGLGGRRRLTAAGGSRDARKTENDRVEMLSKTAAAVKTEKKRRERRPKPVRRANRDNK